MEISTGLANELARYLDLNTPGNMANIDTPGYRAVGMDFEAEMRQSIAQIESDSGVDIGDAAENTGLGEGSGRRRAFPQSRLSQPNFSQPKFSQPKIHAVDGLIVRPDGNNVSMDRESLNLAAAQMRFKMGVALLKSEFSEIMSAIHADAK
jgi:flagellar basal-body rod protein FlgB